MNRLIPGGNLFQGLLGRWIADTGDRFALPEI